ncbi:alpha/beta hydrolase [Methylobacterium variabile]|uniref:Alpha/beta hydrolase n=1 Tax=Methylobacterium variabile TaxID=298794 RepID=A0A0J6T0F1_9HYPH|nr:alpha/beta hydrolase [Methylobacterium variabile]KMO39038.1 alpha/beta hydrolase [Methylobacterium variabile]
MARRPHSVLPLLARQAATVLGLAAVAGGGAWLAYSRLAIDHRLPLPRALPGRLDALDTEAGRVALYGSDEGSGPPLLLVHSVNAAASAYEVRPLFLHERGRRPVYALDLPGFGASERGRRRYTPDLMVAAIHAAAAEVRRRHGGAALDALALSLSAEYLARAALERPGDYRRLALISPTGFDARLSGRAPPGGHRGKDRLRAVLDAPPFGRAVFDALVSRPSMRFFLEKTWGSTDIDEGLLDYGYASAHQPGAEHAPFCFIAGHLFPTDATALYEALDLPVLVIHGSRGDFVDYRDLPRFAGRRNWTVERLPTGAFPHFEDLAAVTRALDGVRAEASSAVA